MEDCGRGRTKDERTGISLPPLIKHTADNMANSVSSQAMCFKERAKLKIVAVRGPKPPCCNSSRFNHVPLANWIMSFSGLYRLLIRNICNTTVKYCQPRHHVNYSHVGQPTDSYRSWRKGKWTATKRACGQLPKWHMDSCLKDVHKCYLNPTYISF